MGCITSRRIETPRDAVVTPSRGWSQTWYSRRGQGATDDVVISSVLPAIQNLSQSLLCVSLGQNSIGDDGAVSLSDVLARCLLLKRIDLSFNRIGSRGAIALSRIFTHCVSISEVVLSQNPFGDEGGCALATAFQRCSAPTLELLELSSCELSSSCMREFGSAIQAQSKMISLDLSRNNIDSSGAECISQSLLIHVCIENVELSNNHIGDDGIVAISQCLSSSNLSIKRIGLNNNNVTTSGAAQFLSLLHSRKGLDYISLGELDPCGPLQSVVKSEAWLRTGLPTPPDEVRDWIPGLAFIREALVSGSQTVRRMRFMLIGNGLAGKTRLAGALLNTQGNSHPHVDVEHRTIGIDCTPLRLDAPGGGIDVEMWDFAGQEVSYLSHTQYFSARRCIYLLVWSPFQPPPHVWSFASVDDITKPLIEWMQLLFLHVPDAQFVLCGTHATAAKQHSDVIYTALFTAVESRVSQKMGDLAALGEEELKSLKRRQQDLEKKLQDASLSMPGNAAVANAEDVVLWNQLSKDTRFQIRQTAIAAANDAMLLRSVRARISTLLDDSTSPPSHKKLQLLDCARIDSSDGSGISDLRNVLVLRCESMPVLSESIPKAWVVAESLFIKMHSKLGNVISRDAAVSFFSKNMSDLKQPWEAIEFWGYLGRVFIYESSPGSAQQWWIIPNMMFLLDLIRPLIHWDPPRMFATNPEFLVASALVLHSDDRNAAEELLVELKRESVLRRSLLNYLAKWSSLQAEQQSAMLDFFHKCHLICALDDTSTSLCVSFYSQAHSYLVTARRDSSVRFMVPVPAALDLNTYHAQFCLPLLHISFLMRLQSRVLARKTSIKLCVQLMQDCLFVRRSTSHVNKFYCCIQCMSSANFTSVQRTLCDEPVIYEEYQQIIHVYSDDLGLFQFATQAIEETLATLFTGLRYKSFILAERNKGSGLGVWLQLGHQSVPTFSELTRKNWFEEFSPGNSLHSLFPHKRCPIFISHSWSDGTETFVRLLRLQLQEESLSAVCLDSAFFDQSACAIQNAFQSGLCEADVAVVCLTPRYITRPNCLKEFQWALDLSAKKRLSVIFLPLHPALTYDGIKSILKHKAVFVSATDDAKCCLFPICELAIELLNRYLLEHIGAKNWPAMRAWLSDSPSGEFDEAALVSEARNLVSKPAVRDHLAVECRADENEKLCKDVNDKLVFVPEIYKNDVSHEHGLCFSPALYPEESAARFFWAFSETLRARQAGSFAVFRWINDLQVTVKPHAAANATSIDDISFEVQCESNGSELKLLSATGTPCKDPNSADKILLSAILLPIGTPIDKIQVGDASNRERWLRVLKKLPMHEIRGNGIRVDSEVDSVTACDLYISTCRKASVSAGRNMQLYLSAMMDSLVRVAPSLEVRITFEFGNFMAKSSAGTAASAKNRIFLLTDDIVLALQDASKRCPCAGCQEIFQYVVDNYKCLVTMHSLSRALPLPLKSGIISQISFKGGRIGECIPSEAYLEGQALDVQVMRLFESKAATVDEVKQTQTMHPLKTAAKHLPSVALQSLPPLYDRCGQPGSSGSVFKIEYQGKPAAVKEFHKHMQGMLRGELKTLQLLAHPNIVRVMAVITDAASEPVGFIMDYLPLPLGDAMQHMTLPQAVHALVEACIGVAVAHDAQVIHSDIKPDNVLCSADCSVVKLADFGLAHAITAAQSGSSMSFSSTRGTPLYVVHAGMACCCCH